MQYLNNTSATQQLLLIKILNTYTDKKLHKMGIKLNRELNKELNNPIN